jgi:hypothetical protein
MNEIKKEIFEISHINGDLKVTPFGPRNVTYYFLCPMLNIGHIFKDKEKTDILVNCFIKDENRISTLKHKVLILIKKTKSNKEYFNVVHQALRRRSNHVYTYYSGVDKEGNDLYMHVFKIPKDCLQYEINILKGSYSKLDEGYRKIIKKTLWLSDQSKMIIGKVIKKDKILKETIEENLNIIIPEGNEIWSKMDSRDVLNKKTFP